MKQTKPWIIILVSFAVLIGIIVTIRLTAGDDKSTRPDQSDIYNAIAAPFTMNDWMSLSQVNCVAATLDQSDLQDSTLIAMTNARFSTPDDVYYLFDHDVAPGEKEKFYKLQNDKKMIACLNGANLTEPPVVD